MWITDTYPATPEVEPCDYRTESPVVLIQTARGEHMTARWVVYQDEEIESVWEMVGRDGLQLERSEVAAWQHITPFVAEAR